MFYLMAKKKFNFTLPEISYPNDIFNKTPIMYPHRMSLRFFVSNMSINNKTK